MEEKTTALAIVREQDNTTSIYDRMGDPLLAIEKMGAWLAKSKMLGVETPEQGIVVAMTCMQERITPLEFRRRYHVIKGTPSMRADYMLAAFQSAGGRIHWDRTDDEEAQLTLTHPVHAPDGFTVVVAMAKLEERKLITEQYRKFPRQMLRARAASEGVRAVMPGINFGTYTQEEPEQIQQQERPSWSEKEERRPGAVIEAEPYPDTPESGQPSPTLSPLSDRAKKVIAAFKSLGVLQEDLESFAGGFDEKVWAAEWTDAHFAAFTEVRKSILETLAESRAEKIRGLFQLPPGSMG